MSLAISFLILVIFGFIVERVLNHVNGGEVENELAKAIIDSLEFQYQEWRIGGFHTINETRGWCLPNLEGSARHRVVKTFTQNIGGLVYIMKEVKNER